MTYSTTLDTAPTHLQPTDVPLKPPLKWAGGKRWLVPRLRPIWAAHQGRRLVEPFGGCLAVTLAVRPVQALLNDINPHAINFYRWLKRSLHAKVPMHNERELYYTHRERFNRLIATGNGDTQEAAELFYYLNRTGYNGLCRFNKHGGYNVPFGRHKSIAYLQDFSSYAPVFAQWEFTSTDFEQIKLHPDDFVYADPPYDVQFRQYSRQGFTWEDQVRLAEWLARHPGPAVLSNQATERIIELYTSLGFTLTFLDAPRTISCTGDRTRATEVLATRGTSL